MSEFWQFFATHYKYVIYAVLMMIGLFAVMAKSNLVKKIIGLSILQTAVFLFYISIGDVDEATVPVYWDEAGPARVRYENPLPHVLMLTAIVVGVSITAVALALVVRIKNAYGTISEPEVLAIDEADEEESA